MLINFKFNFSAQQRCENKRTAVTSSIENDVCNGNVKTIFPARECQSGLSYPEMKSIEHYAKNNQSNYVRLHLTTNLINGT